MRPEKPRVLPLGYDRATPREKQQPPRKPAIPARALARKMLVKSKRRALRFMWTNTGEKYHSAGCSYLRKVKSQFLFQTQKRRAIPLFPFCNPAPLKGNNFKGGSTLEYKKNKN